MRVLIDTHVFIWWTSDSQRLSLPVYHLLCDRNTKALLIYGMNKFVGDTVPGQRNYAILRLLWDNGLRRSEVTKLNAIESG